MSLTSKHFSYKLFLWIALVLCLPVLGVQLLLHSILDRED